MAVLHVGLMPPESLAADPVRADPDLRQVFTSALMLCMQAKAPCLPCEQVQVLVVLPPAYVVVTCSTGVSLRSLWPDF